MQISFRRQHRKRTAAASYCLGCAVFYISFIYVILSVLVFPVMWLSRSHDHNGQHPFGFKQQSSNPAQGAQDAHPIKSGHKSAIISSQLMRYQQSQFFACLGAIWENVLQGHLDKERRATRRHYMWHREQRGSDYTGWECDYILCSGNHDCTMLQTIICCCNAQTPFIWKL